MIRVIFDGPPGPEAGRFVEVEDAAGRSFVAGEWKPCVDRPEWWELQIDPRAHCDCEGCQNAGTWPADVEQILARCKEATPAPWGIEEGPIDLNGAFAFKITGRNTRIQGHANSSADITFIASARSDVPALAKLVWDARAQRDRIKTQIWQMQGSIDEVLARADRSDEEAASAKVEIQRLRTLIDRDATGLSAALGKIGAAVRSKEWILDGRGSYEWDDERYREEVGPVMREVVAICESSLSNSGTLAIAAFHPEMAVADERRTALEQELAASQQRVRELEELLNDGAEGIVGLAESAKKSLARADTCEAAVRKLLRAGEAWSLAEAAARLVEFANYVLRDRDYDGHGWEEVQRAATVVAGSIWQLRMMAITQSMRDFDAAAQQERGSNG